MCAIKGENENDNSQCIFQKYNEHQKKKRKRMRKRKWYFSVNFLQNITRPKSETKKRMRLKSKDEAQQ